MADYKSQSTEEQLDRDRQWEKSLEQALYRASCPSPQDLGEYQLGMLASAASDQIDLHLAGCPHCTQELVQLDDFLVQTEPVKPPPLIEPPKIQVFIARLVEAISGTHKPSLKMRYALRASNPLAPPPQYSYEVDDVKISFDMTMAPADPQQWTVEGDIDTGDDEDAQWQAEVWRTDLAEPVRTQLTEIDPLEMSIEGLNAGEYTLIFSDCSTREIRIPDLKIG